MKYSSFLLITILLGVACTNPENKDAQNSEKEVVKNLPSELDKLNQIILDNPDELINYQNRAQYYIGIEEFDKAKEDIGRGLRIDSTHSELYHIRGELYYFTQKIELAIRDFEKCLEFNPDHKECLLKKAEIDMLMRNYDEAIVNINNSLRIDEFNPIAYYMKGLLYKEIGDSSLAVSSYRTAVELDPEYYDAYIQIALLYASANSDLAIEYYNSALSIKPNSIEALYNKAMFLQETGKKDENRYHQAKTIYSKMEELDPSFPSANYNKGFIYLEYLSEYDSAAFEFSKAIDKLPSSHESYYNRGLCYESLDKYDLALEDYDKALEIYPSYTPAALAKGRLVDNKN